MSAVVQAEPIAERHGHHYSLVEQVQESREGPLLTASRALLECLRKVPEPGQALGKRQTTNLLRSGPGHLLGQ